MNQMIIKEIYYFMTMVLRCCLLDPTGVYFTQVYEDRGRRNDDSSRNL